MTLPTGAQEKLDKLKLASLRTLARSKGIQVCSSCSTIRSLKELIRSHQCCAKRDIVK